MPNQPQQQPVDPEKTTVSEDVTPASHREPCPLWCQGYHLSSPHAEDQVHESEGFAIEMGVPKADGSDGGNTTHVEPADVSIYAARWPGLPTTWLVLSYGAGHRFRVRVDHGILLAQAITGVVGEVAGACTRLSAPSREPAHTHDMPSFEASSRWP